MSLVFATLALLILGRIIVKIASRQEYQEPEPDTDYLPGWHNSITDTIYDSANGMLNWLSKIFTNSDVVEIGIGLLFLYLIETLCFHATDEWVIFVLVNLAILSRGIREYGKEYVSSLTTLKENIKGSLHQLLPKGKEAEEAS